MQQSRHKEAEADLDIAIKHDSTYLLSFFNRAIVYSSTNRPMLALSDFDHVIELDSTNSLTYAKPRVKSDISYRDALIIGLAQAVAVMPGLSRSGSTIATGLLLGNEKSTVSHFSFLMVLPPILGNALLDIVKGDFGGDVEFLPLLAGFITAFVVGYFACRFMIEIVKRGKLIWFAIYCAIVGLISIVTSIVA
jgi:undecaprenyl-diphosphatase UppP